MIPTLATGAATRDDLLAAHRIVATQRLMAAGLGLADRQLRAGSAAGNVPPWPGCHDPDLHGTLGCLWLWSRAQALTGQRPFEAQIALAWRFVARVLPSFVPAALGGDASDEAPHDCACLLAAASAGEAPAGMQALADRAGRILGSYLAELGSLEGRAFADPAFLVWHLAEHARRRDDRALAATARAFVERAFGMRAPAPFEVEAEATGGLFDFTSTTATRVLAVIATEGNTPFVGAWLRERVAPLLPAGFIPRALDENVWNASMATALGRSFLVATHPDFHASYQLVLAELLRRVDPATGLLGRQPGLPNETIATFHLGLALDALVPA